MVRAALRVPLPALGARRRRAASSSSCARRSSPGTCSARRRAAAAPRATSTRRSSACRSRSSGLTDGRHVVNVQRPARAAAPDRRRAASSSAGVRYRAWQPPSACTRRSRVHAPLVFDLVDTWTGRSLGGCTYHVAHPGGRSYETFPVNANEAEARRVARFSPSATRPAPHGVAPPASEREPRASRSRSTCAHGERRSR